ncbi:MAG: hypothetical protein KatS3mg057_1089 [Herpetosiphonaceae bacterium]|nr:MAG: hypothetical protein KatS3mg057_1089 [Herpetosiphonaceae bacterium]
MFPWIWEPIPLFELLIVQSLYLLAVGPLRHRFSGSAPVGRGTIVAFSLGIVSAALALVTPLDALSVHLLSAHMIQHLLLTMVTAPLLLIGTPAWLARPYLRNRTVARLAHTITRPLPALLIFNAIFLGWHVPALYDLALRSLPIHILEHLLFLGAALVAWWPILSPLPEIPRATYPVQILYLFVQSIPPTIVGAIIALADEPIYPTYAAMPRVWDIDVMTDQTVGGLIMWIPGALIFLVALTVVWFIWMNDNDQAETVIYGETVEGRR